MDVRFGQPGTAADTFQRSAISRRSFDDVLATLRQAIEEAGMKVLQEIDPQKALASFGHVIDGSRLVFFFHPNLVIRLLQTDWTAIIEAPLKLAVTELPNGTTSLRMADPAAAFARYGNAALTTFGQELAVTCEGIITASV